MTETVVEEPGPGVPGLFGDSWDKAQAFAGMLVREGELRGLIGPRELPRLWSRHIVNSAAVAQYVGPDDSVIDVGSGAGFPGVVVALLRPEADIHLIEPMERRVEWLSDVVSELGLTNVTIHRGRADEFDGVLEAPVVTARVVAALDKLVRWTLPLVSSGGALVALKGARAPEEISAARKWIRKLGGLDPRIDTVVPASDEDEATIVFVSKR